MVSRDLVGGRYRRYQRVVRRAEMFLEPKDNPKLLLGLENEHQTCSGSSTSPPQPRFSRRSFVKSLPILCKFLTATIERSAVPDVVLQRISKDFTKESAAGAENFARHRPWEDRTRSVGGVRRRAWAFSTPTGDVQHARTVYSGPAAIFKLLTQRKKK